MIPAGLIMLAGGWLLLASIVIALLYAHGEREAELEEGDRHA